MYVGYTPDALSIDLNTRKLDSRSGLCYNNKFVSIEHVLSLQ